MPVLRPAILLFLTLAMICGGFYPGMVTILAQVIFPVEANGSFISDGRGKVIGSALIGQPCSDPAYFWPRPSATAGFAYNPLSSGGSNAGPSNPDYLLAVRERVRVLRASGMEGLIPAELVQASASGLDPHITPEAALSQIPRIAKYHRLGKTELATLVAGKTVSPQLGIFGEPRVNVLELNLALDAISPPGRSQTEKP